MKPRPANLCSALLVLIAFQAAAVTRYVNLNSPNPTLPYTSWTTAATNIQDAVDAADPGDEVLVTNGVYATGGKVLHPYQATNRVAITKPLTVQSVNGPEVTVIEGYQVPGTIFGTNAVRCAYLTNGAMLAGFTLTNGSTRDLVYQDAGGGVRCESASAVVSNCVLIANAAIYVGGGAYKGTLVNCTLTRNVAPYGNTGGYGGGASSAVLFGCLVVSNSALVTGGGVISCVLNDCTVAGNSAGESGGGAATSSLNNCTVTGNRAAMGGGTYGGTVVVSSITSNSASASGGGAYGGNIQNTIIAGNIAPVGGGMHAGNLQTCVVAGNVAVISNGVSLSFGNSGGGLYQVYATNCTITGNSALRGGGADNCTLVNCILYYNYAAKYSGYDNYLNSALYSCCTSPKPLNGAGNIVSEPQLLSASYLHASSPCLGAGSAANIAGADIDGEVWRDSPAIGCDEYFSGGQTGLLSVAVESDYTSVGRSFPISFVARIAGRPSAVRWDFGNGVVVSNRAYVSHEWATAGSYQVILTAFNHSFPGGIAATTLVQVIDQIHYVRTNNPSPVPPYLSWATAATNIQQAIDATSLPGALVLVSNGVYNSGARRLAGYISNRVAVTQPLMLRSVNGPGVTTIRGNPTPPVRGVYLTNGAVLSGFTIANGGTLGSGGETAYDQAGAGIYCESSHAVISNCVVTQSRAAYQGGGVNHGTLYQCVVSNNAATFYGGGVYHSEANNTLISSNSAGNGGGAFFARLVNCTVTTNRSTSGSSALQGGTARNSIIFFNTSGGAAPNHSGTDLEFCCTVPVPAGIGNFTNHPTFVNQSGSIFRLQSNSPCINSGSNTGVPEGPDLDASPRNAGGTVDIGAYEFQTPSSVLSYVWAQQNGLPTDGSVDYTDTDGDGHNNWQEWCADTVPTNTLSVLRMLDVTSVPGGLDLRWQSAATRSYWLERLTHFGGAVPFQTVATNIAGINGVKSFTDLTATNAGPYFYRVGVQQ